MASKESTGLQAALIVFVIIAVGLGIWVFMAQSQVTELKAEKKKAVEAEATTRMRASFRDAQVRYLLHATGFAKLEDVDVQATFDEMQRLLTSEIGANVKPDYDQMTQVRGAFESETGRVGDGGKTYLQETHSQYPHWRNIASYYEYLLKEKARVAATDVDTIKKEKDDLQAALTADVKRAEAERDKFKDMAAQLAKVDADANALRAKYGSQLTEIEEKLKAKDNKYNADTMALAKQIKDRNARVQTVENLNKGLVTRNKKLYRKDFDQPDGQITWVNQRSRTVWIDLGLGDGLYRQTSFSVYDKSDGSFARGQTEARKEDGAQGGFDVKDYSKAEIEVTRIISRNQAEARIVRDDISNPILPGDVIFTPAWVPGQTVKFALAGFMDEDGDGKSDRELIKNMISVTGGEVVAEVTDNGEFQGAVSLDTRYLVLGERPTDKTGSETIKNYGKITGLADDYGIEKIEFKKFLGFMGFNREVRTVPLGGGGTEGFAPRRPPVRGESGAY